MLLLLLKENWGCTEYFELKKKIDKDRAKMESGGDRKGVGVRYTMF